MNPLQNPDGESPDSMNAMTIESEPSYPPMQDNAEAGEITDGAILVFVIIYVTVLVVLIVGLWKMFSKANIPGILAIIPIVNLFFLPKVAGKPGWWGLLFFIPLFNIVIAILVMMGIADRFNRGVGTALGLIFLTPIFYCILGFGSAKWTPPPAEG